MNSLEIVNEELNDIKELGWCDEVVMDKIKFLETIKQDLEVLEIIRNKNVDIGRFKARCYISSTPHQLMRTYNCDCNYIDDELSIDEVIKLKQWQESNKVGDSNV